MNLTDEALRESLHARADRLTPPVDVFAGVETRARRIKRRRVGASVAGAVAAVAAVAIVVPTLVNAPHHTNRVRVGGPSPTQPAPTDSSSPTPTSKPSANSAAVLDPAAPWPYRGDSKVIAAATLDRFQSDWSARYPDSGELEPLWGDIYEPSQQPELLFVAKVGNTERWGVATWSANGTQFVVDQSVAPNTTVLAAVVPGDEVPRLLAVAAPSTTAIRYAPDGVNFADMTMIEPGVAVRGLQGKQSIDKLQVVGANGAVVFDGPAPDSAEVATNHPANVLGWPSRGTVPEGLIGDLTSAYAQSRQIAEADVVFAPLAGGVDAAGTQFVLGQAWVAGDQNASTVGYLKHADGSTELQLLAEVAASAALVAIDVTDSPTTASESLVIVPQPATGQVLYAADGKSYQPENADPAGGSVVIARDPKASSDKVRVLDGDGKTTFDGPVFKLLCGVTSCG
ncbi:MAG: hypothetical protein ACRDV3_08235 [Acidothermaceae bacterium]